MSFKFPFYSDYGNTVIIIGSSII